MVKTADTTQSIKDKNKKIGKNKKTGIKTVLKKLATEKKPSDPNKKASKTGGKIAKNARQALEEKTGKSIISEQNYLPPETHPL